MSPIVKELRNAAKCAPLWKTIFEAAADEIERLQGEQNKVKADSVREAINSCYDAYDVIEDYASKLEDYANKIERGEL